MWTLQPTEEFARKYKWFEKKRPRELEAMLLNLQTYLTALEFGTKPMQIKYKFVHPEPMDVYAIDQRGGAGKLAQARLYLHPDLERRILHQLTIGDKKSQASDILFCKQFIAALIEAKANESEQGEGDDEEAVS
jgi:hypothetical protein